MQSTMSLRGGSTSQDLTQHLGDHHGYLLRMRMEGGLEGIELGPLLGKARNIPLPLSGHIRFPLPDRAGTMIWLQRTWQVIQRGTGVVWAQTVSKNIPAECSVGHQ